MTQNFIESSSKLPEFYYFAQTLENFNNNIRLAVEIVEEFQNNFEQLQAENWYKFWLRQGAKIVLDTWNIKYKDYLLSAGDDDSENKCVDEETVEEKAETDIAESTCNDYSWNDLWQQHEEEIYAEQYIIFCSIFYNYFLDLKSSLENVDSEREPEEQAEQTQNIEEEYISQELEQLKLLGLPAAFSGRPQKNSSKKRKKDIVDTADLNIYFTDTDSEEMLELKKEEEEKVVDEKEKKVVDDHNLHGIENHVIQKKKKINRKLKNIPKFMLEENGLLKYWRKRYSLFSRFDEGIRLDRESWFSVTPEKIAAHLAERLQCDCIVDGFCGSGGNAIQFALKCKRVIAIDIDPIKLQMAKHNAKIYNVDHKIDFILADFLQFAKTKTKEFTSDIVFLSPPWGGPKYKTKKAYDIEKNLLPVSATELVEASKSFSSNIALFLPRNSNVKQIIKLAGIGNRCEIEHNYLDTRLVAITALYGSDILNVDKNVD